MAESGLATFEFDTNGAEKTIFSLSDTLQNTNAKNKKTKTNLPIPTMPPSPGFAGCYSDEELVVDGAELHPADQPGI